MLQKAYGEEKTEEYPVAQHPPRARLSVPLGAVAAAAAARVRPIAPDKTLSEIWHFRLKGAPEAIYRRSLWYYNLVNSPATMINADDLENWTKGQWGLASDGGDWVSFHRNYGRDTGRRRRLTRTTARREAPMRNQFRAWLKYMTAAA